MKIKADVRVGIMLSAIPNGSTFIHKSHDTRIYMKLTLNSTNHVGFIKPSDKQERLALVDCETGEVKSWLDCEVIPVATVLVNDK